MTTGRERVQREDAGHREESRPLWDRARGIDVSFRYSEQSTIKKKKNEMFVFGIFHLF